MFDFLFFFTTQYCMLFLPYFLYGLNFFSVVGTTRTTRPTWRKCKLNRNFLSVLTSVFPPVRFLNVLSIRPSDCPFVRPPVRPSRHQFSNCLYCYESALTTQRLTRLVALQVSKFIHEQKSINCYMLVCYGDYHLIKFFLSNCRVTQGNLSTDR